jgi:tryptophan-rich sensory protein
LIGYALFFVAVFLYWKDDYGHGAYDAFFSIFLVVIILDKIWLWVHLIFPAWGGVISVIFVILMLVGVCFLIAFAGVAKNWISFGFLLAYLVWVIYLIVISIQFHRGSKKIRAAEGGGGGGGGYRPLSGEPQ